MESKKFTSEQEKYAKVCRKIIFSGDTEFLREFL